MLQGDAPLPEALQTFESVGFPADIMDEVRPAAGAGAGGPSLQGTDGGCDALLALYHISRFSGNLAHAPPQRGARRCPHALQLARGLQHEVAVLICRWFSRGGRWRAQQPELSVLLRRPPHRWSPGLPIESRQPLAVGGECTICVLALCPGMPSPKQGMRVRRSVPPAASFAALPDAAPAAAAALSGALAVAARAAAAAHALPDAATGLRAGRAGICSHAGDRLALSCRRLLACPP